MYLHQRNPAPQWCPNWVYGSLRGLFCTNSSEPNDRAGQPNRLLHACTRPIRTLATNQNLSLPIRTLVVLISQPPWKPRDEYLWLLFLHVSLLLLHLKTFEKENRLTTKHNFSLSNETFLHVTLVLYFVSYYFWSNM
jgi:hypothetical protein